MKNKKLLTIFLLLLSGFTYAQTTYVPDDNFENYLETHDASGNTVAVGDTNSMGNGIADDDSVLTSRITNVTSLNVSNLNIANLTGIEDFTALQNLFCDGNNLTTLDITQNMSLQELYCRFNQLTDIDITHNTLLQNLVCSFNSLTGLNISQNTALQHLQCSFNSLTTLSVTQNTALLSITCQNNQLTSLDVSQNTALQTFDCSGNQLTNLNLKNGNNTNLGTFNATGNPDLTCVFVDNASYMNTNWANAIDATATYVENQAQCDALQTTYVPDDNFENYLETHDATGYPVAIGDANSMGNGIANDDYVITSKISNVTNLIISGNSIVHLTGIEDFAALENLDCSYNQLTNLDVSYNTNLQTLNCYSNQLTSLNVSQNTALQTLDCSDNQLTNLNVSQNTALQTLDCSDNQLTSLNVSQNTALQTLYCYNNQLTNLDVSHNTNLQTLNCYDNQLASLNVQNTALQTLECSGNQLTSLNVSQNTALQTLNCSNNQLTNLNLSHNTGLISLYCSYNQLTSLNTTQNVNLQKLECYNNQLTDLDVSQNTGLVRLNCSNNRLTGLNLQNGNNTNLIYFNATVNPDLTCVFVDDTNYMNTHWHGTIDATAFYVETQAECDTLTHTTYVPDDNFENYLETHDANGNTVAVGDTGSMGNGIANDDVVLTHRISNVIHLNISQNNISDLTGIADFTDLQQLNCASNQLTSLDVSHNLALQTLNCSNNQLTNLNTSQNTALHTLNCFDNQLTSLNVSQNTALQTLDCYENQLTSLNVSQNTVLESLACGFNQITELDVSQNTSLTSLSCHYNQLTGLNLQNGNNTNFTYFAANNNPDLSCIFVDDANYMNTHWANAIDIMETYVENQTQCNAAMQTTYVPDDNFENYLETHGANGGIVPLGNINSMGNGIANDNYVLTSRINDITNLDISSQNISDLTGITAFTALQEFVCSDNQLTGINVSQNTALERLYCSDNQLTNINLSQNTNLEALYCSNNQITSLDVSQNTGLTELECFSNQLTSLDLRNGNHTNLTDFDANGNPNLTCIFVDDANYMNTNWGGAIDATATYVETQAECDALTQTTYIPDGYFEIYLETHDVNGNIVPLGNPNSLGNGTYDNYVPTSKISNVTNLDIHFQNISDLTGIEDFTALQVLYCYSNTIATLDLSQNTALQELNCSLSLLTSLDLSHNPALQTLLCYNTHLTSLNVTQNASLQELNCRENQLTSLDVTHNPALQKLYCNNNQLSSLDVTQNPALQDLQCYSNQLTNLDITQNPVLQILYCDYNQITDINTTQNPSLLWFNCHANQLTSLDVSQNPDLQELICNGNQLTNLDMRNGHNTNLITFYALGNNLTCVFVDDKNYMNTNWASAIDATATYVETQAECDALGIDEAFKESIHIYPNPIDEYLNIRVPDKANIKSISIQNMQGQIVYQSDFAPQIKLADLPVGMYFLRIENKTGDKAVFKLIKD